MKYLLVLMLLLPVCISAQYMNDRAAEQSFENSPLYFKSYYLNTFGLPGFKDIAAGFVRDPFLNLYNNPANLPDLKDKEMSVYLDFRGDRKEPVLNNYTVPVYYAASFYSPWIDPRWYSNVRTEPEPVFSLGILTYPIKEITGRLFVGATYQLIHRQEKYYSMPTGIYYPVYGYDAFNVKSAQSAVPIIDRQTGSDEMLTDGHLFTAYAGYKISDNLNAGVSLNGVVHKRTGLYANIENGPYTTGPDPESFNNNSQAKEQKYHHLDLSAGLSYEVTPRLTLGAKAGILSGTADQTYNSTGNYFYQHNIPNVSAEWTLNRSNSVTDQIWKHEGKTKYFSLDLARQTASGHMITAIYRYSKSNLDLSQFSHISDSSYYNSRYINTYNAADVYDYNSHSYMNDDRQGTGSKTEGLHEAMLNFQWDLTPNANLSTGIYYSNSSTDISSSEPVTANRFSEYFSSGPVNSYHSIYTTHEIKTLEWRYSSSEWTLQIPVLVNFRLGEKFGWMVGLNRIIKSWEIQDETIAYFDIRSTNTNGEQKTERNFGERTRQPNQKMTDNSTEFITKFEINISPDFLINLTMKPEFEHLIGIAQWWISFKAEL